MVLFMILGCVSVSARSVAQNQRVSLNLRNCTVMQLFEEIQQQTRLFFFYDQKHFQGQNVLTVRADDEEIGGLLKRLFADKNVEFVFEDQTVIVRPAVSRKQVNGKVVKGVVRDAAGHVLPGVTVVLKGTTLGTSTDIDGKYKIKTGANETLSFSYLGYATQDIPIAGKTRIDVKLAEDSNAMEEVVVVGAVGGMGRHGGAGAVRLLARMSVVMAVPVQLENIFDEAFLVLIDVQGGYSR